MKLADLSALIEKSVKEARDRVEAARTEAANAQASLKEAEEYLAALMVEADRRRSAIQLVTDMLAQADGQKERLPYRNMNQDDAMRHALLVSQKTMNSSELAAVLKRGGYQFSSTNPANSLVVAANANRKAYFTTTKEGNRTIIGLSQWNPDDDGAPNPFEFFNDEPGDGIRR